MHVSSIPRVKARRSSYNYLVSPKKANWPVPKQGSSSEFSRLMPITISDLVNMICREGNYDKQSVMNYIQGSINRNNSRIKSQGKYQYRKDQYIDHYEAYEFAKKLGFDNFDSSKNTPLVSDVFKTLQNRFFDGSAFHESRATLKPFVVTLSRCADGDTCTVEGPKVCMNGRWRSITFRFSSVDTPESISGNGNWKNPKTEKFKDYIWRYWKSTSGISNQQKSITKHLIHDRIVYSGLMASAAMKGLRAWMFAKEIPFTADPTFNHAPSNPNECGTLETVDTYGRLIARIRAGRPDEKRNLLADFICNELPGIMTSGSGHQYYQLFRNGTYTGNEKDPYTNIAAHTNEGKRALADMAKMHPELYRSVATETLKDPSKMFSRENCKILAKEWITFSSSHPEYKNDVAAMLVFLGLGYAYPKYKDNHTDKYLALEDMSMKRRFGMNNDNIFDLMRPHPKRSALAAMYEHDKEFTGGRPLLPADSC